MNAWSSVRLSHLWFLSSTGWNTTIHHSQINILIYAKFLYRGGNGRLCVTINIIFEHRRSSDINVNAKKLDYKRRANRSIIIKNVYNNNMLISMRYIITIIIIIIMSNRRMDRRDRESGLTL